MSGPGAHPAEGGLSPTPPVDAPEHQAGLDPVADEDNLRERLALQSRSLAQARAQNAVLRRAILAEQESVQKLQADSRAQKIELHKLSEESSILNFHNGRLTRRVESLQEEIRQIEATSGSAWIGGIPKKEYARVCGELDTIKDDLSLRISEAARLHSLVADLEAEVAEAAAHAAALRQRLTETQEQSEQLTQEKEQLLLEQRLAAEQAEANARIAAAALEESRQAASSALTRLRETSEVAHSAAHAIVLTSASRWRAGGWIDPGRITSWWLLDMQRRWLPPLALPLQDIGKAWAALAEGLGQFQGLLKLRCGNVLSLDESPSIAFGVDFARLSSVSLPESGDLTGPSDMASPGGMSSGASSPGSSDSDTTLAGLFLQLFDAADQTGPLEEFGTALDDLAAVLNTSGPPAARPGEGLLDALVALLGHFGTLLRHHQRQVSFECQTALRLLATNEVPPKLLQLITSSQKLVSYFSILIVSLEKALASVSAEREAIFGRGSACPGPGGRHALLQTYLVLRSASSHALARNTKDFFTALAGFYSTEKAFVRSVSAGAYRLREAADEWSALRELPNACGRIPGQVAGLMDAFQQLSTSEALAAVAAHAFIAQSPSRPVGLASAASPAPSQQLVLLPRLVTSSNSLPASVRPLISMFPIAFSATRHVQSATRDGLMLATDMLAPGNRGHLAAGADRDDLALRTRSYMLAGLDLPAEPEFIPHHEALRQASVAQQAESKIRTSEASVAALKEGIVKLREKHSALMAQQEALRAENAGLQRDARAVQVTLQEHRETERRLRAEVAQLSEQRAASRERVAAAERATQALQAELRSEAQLRRQAEAEQAELRARCAALAAQVAALEAAAATAGAPAGMAVAAPAGDLEPGTKPPGAGSPAAAGSLGIHSPSPSPPSGSDSESPVPSAALLPAPGSGAGASGPSSPSIGMLLDLSGPSFPEPAASPPVPGDEFAFSWATVAGSPGPGAKPAAQASPGSTEQPDDGFGDFVNSGPASPGPGSGTSAGGPAGLQAGPPVAGPSQSVHVAPASSKWGHSAATVLFEDPLTGSSVSSLPLPLALPGDFVSPEGAASAAASGVSVRLARLASQRTSAEIRLRAIESELAACHQEIALLTTRALDAEGRATLALEDGESTRRAYESQIAIMSDYMAQLQASSPPSSGGEAPAAAGTTSPGSASSGPGASSSSDEGPQAVASGSAAAPADGPIDMEEFGSFTFATFPSGDE